MTVLYEDSRSMKTIARGLVEEYPRGAPIAVTVRDALRRPDTLWLLIPDDEVAALTEIVKYGEKLHGSLQAPLPSRGRAELPF